MVKRNTDRQEGSLAHYSLCVFEEGKSRGNRFARQSAPLRQAPSSLVEPEARMFRSRASATLALPWQSPPIFSHAESRHDRFGLLLPVRVGAHRGLGVRSHDATLCALRSSQKLAIKMTRSVPKRTSSFLPDSNSQSTVPIPN